MRHFPNADDLTKDEGNSKDNAVEVEEVGIIRCFLTTIERTVYVNVYNVYLVCANFYL